MAAITSLCTCGAADSLRRLTALEGHHVIFSLRRPPPLPGASSVSIQRFPAANQGVSFGRRCFLSAFRRFLRLHSVLPRFQPRVSHRLPPFSLRLPLFFIRLSKVPCLHPDFPRFQSRGSLHLLLFSLSASAVFPPPAEGSSLPSTDFQLFSGPIRRPQPLFDDPTTSCPISRHVRQNFRTPIKG